jgi:hypothetical protein
MEHMTFKAPLWSADALSLSLPSAFCLGSLLRSSLGAHAPGRGVAAVFMSNLVRAQAGASGDVRTSGASGISSVIAGRRVGRHFRSPSGLLHRDGGQGAASRVSFNTATAALRLSISAVILPTRAASMLALSKGLRELREKRSVVLLFLIWR